MPFVSRREFLGSAAAAARLAWPRRDRPRRSPGDRPQQAPEVTVLNPGTRVPVGLIIDDSTCLVNLNRFAMPQFDEAFGGSNKVYARDWRTWPVEIPDSFVRKFGTWCAEHGVKGKYTIVPYPACVGRLDRGLPGWTRRELEDSLELVRTLMVPNWDIHPEMVTHTRVIDLTTGHPYPDQSVDFMENWDWTTGRSADELAAYLAYALRILKEVGLPCEGITTPGGFGAKVLPQLAVATGQAVRDVFKAEIPHYFRHAIIRGPESVAPRVENASGLDGPDPQCVVSIVACTNDWTGGWDNTPPGGPDPFITPDLKSGRMVEVIERGEPAVIMSHWTGIHWNGQELGFKVFQEVVRRLHATVRQSRLDDAQRDVALLGRQGADAHRVAGGSRGVPGAVRVSAVYGPRAARSGSRPAALARGEAPTRAAQRSAAGDRSLERDVVRHAGRPRDLPRPAAWRVRDRGVIRVSNG